jgi:hypothetical protein
MPFMEQSSNSGLNLGLISIPQSLLLQTGTVSILLLLLAQKGSQSALVAMGQASEEIFRGDRLPILNFPNEDELSRS